MPTPVTPAQLAAIPAEHRALVARFLIERAAQFKPSFVLSAEMTSVIQAALTGAAVDLHDPESDDSTLGHVAVVVAELGPAV